MDKRTCSTCVYCCTTFMPATCRLNPPAVVTTPMFNFDGKQTGSYNQTIWPEINPDVDWCGCHTPEIKVIEDDGHTYDETVVHITDVHEDQA